MPQSELEKGFSRVWRMVAKGRPDPDTQHKFHPVRLWRFDFAWPAHRVAVEMEGGIISIAVTCNHCRKPVLRFNRRSRKWQRVWAVMGGHTTTEGFIKDCEKYNAAAELGWRVLRYTIKDLESRPVQVIEQVVALLKQGKVPGVEEQGRLF